MRAAPRVQKGAGRRAEDVGSLDSHPAAIVSGPAVSALRPPASALHPTTYVLRRAILSVLIFAAACERENRRYDDSPRQAITPTLSELQPGPTMVVAKSEEGVYDDNAWGTNEGKRLFNWMNCSGCHSNGGGGMGPALMDDQWIYGAEPEQIYHTILEGRPNGMPSFRHRLTAAQIWQLTAYVRSLSGLTPKGARPARDDHMMGKPAEQQTPNAKPKQTTPPPPPPPAP